MVQAGQGYPPSVPPRFQALLAVLLAFALGLLVDRWSTPEAEPVEVLRTVAAPVDDRPVARSRPPGRSTADPGDWEATRAWYDSLGEEGLADLENRSKRFQTRIQAATDGWVCARE